MSASWRRREILRKAAKYFHAILDNLGDILAQAGLETRVGRERIAVVGHSWGAQTAGAILGARVLDADGVPGEDFSHSAVSADRLIPAAGTGDTLTPFAAEDLPFLKPDFSTMATPALVIAGSKDQSQLTTRGAGVVHRHLPPQPGPQEPAHHRRGRAHHGRHRWPGDTTARRCKQYIVPLERHQRDRPVVELRPVRGDGRCGRGRKY